MKTVAVTISAALVLLLAAATSFCRAANVDPSLRQTMEIISVLKSNYVDHDKLDEKLLNEASVTGILGALGRGAVILTPETSSTNGTKAVDSELKL